MEKTFLTMNLRKYSIYSLYGFLELFYFFCKTKIFFKNALLIRFPIFIRGRQFIKFGKQMTTGRFCRFDAFPILHLNKKDQIIKFGKNVEIGDRVHIAALKGIEIGDRCLIASNVFISDHDHGETKSSDLSNTPKQRSYNVKKVLIGSDCWIGQNVCILKGCKIGRNSVIGAGSVVTKSFPDYSVIAGNPAGIINKSS